MGLMCSWLAVKGAAPSKIFEALDVVPTGQVVEPWSDEEALSYRTMPNGWTVIYSEDFDWANRDRIRSLSDLGLVVGCQLEDKVANTSAASAARAGVELWHVFHSLDPENGPDHDLRASGELPAAYPTICRDYGEKDQSEADYRHEIPIRTAEAVCGFNLEELGEGESDFTGLRPVGRPYKARRKIDLADILSRPILKWLEGSLALLEWLDDRIFKYLPRPIANALRFIAFSIVFGAGWTLPFLPFACLIGWLRRH